MPQLTRSPSPAAAVHPSDRLTQRGSAGALRGAGASREVDAFMGPERPTRQSAVQGHRLHIDRAFTFEVPDRPRRVIEPDGHTASGRGDEGLGSCVVRLGDTHRMTASMDFEFEGVVVEWRGPAPFYFVAIPEEDSEGIKFAAKGLEYWGQVPVIVRIRDNEFTTALFPRDGCYLLPLKDMIRKSTGVGLGEVVAVALRVGRQ